MRLFGAMLVASALLPLVAAECPRGCTGHGDCDSNDSCQCHTGYMGADCSERICPAGIAFADAPRGDLNHDGVVKASAVYATAYSKVQWSSWRQYEAWPTVAGAASYKAGSGDLNPSAILGGGWAAQADEAHFYAECSGKGLCNRQTGSCACFDGYEGGSCQRTVCPNSCSGHGLCTLVSDLASGGVNAFVDSRNGYNAHDGVLRPFRYNLWDADKNTKCKCDAGYSGADCSLRSCPRGDDPLTVSNPVCGNARCMSETQTFVISGSSNNGKKYRIRFFDLDGVQYTTNVFAIATSTPSASNTDTQAAQAANQLAVKGALESLPMGATGNVTVTCTSVSASSTVANMRCAVSFVTLSGNLPEFIVEPVTGAPVIAQPSQPVHTLTVTLGPVAGIVTVTVFPNDMTGFRTAQFSGTATTSLTAGPTITAVASAIDEALQSGASAAKAFTYKHGTTAAQVSGYGNTITIVMPSKAFGANPIKALIASTGGNTVTSTVTSNDGNTEASVCANRGLCDTSSGLCKCFAGYTGAACETQNALAM